MPTLPSTHDETKPSAQMNLLDRPAGAIGSLVATRSVHFIALLGLCAAYWLGALWLAGFTLFATFVANRFWEMLLPQRFMVENSFFEQLGLIGGFLLVAWLDLRKSHRASIGDSYAQP